MDNYYTAKPGNAENLDFIIRNRTDGSPTFFVSAELKAAIKKAELTGCKISENTHPISGEESTQAPTVKLFSLEISGTYCNDDFSMNTRGILIVSENAKKVLTKFTLKNIIFLKIYKDVSYHVYDVEITKILESFKIKLGTNHPQTTSLKNIIHTVSGIPEEYRKRNETGLTAFIIRHDMRSFPILLAYKLLSSEIYKIPFILNYHYETWKHSDKINFVNIIEFTVLDFISNLSIKKIVTNKILNVISEWIAKKHTAIETYFDYTISNEEIETYLIDTFTKYSQEKMNNKVYLEANTSTITYIAKRILNNDYSEHKGKKIKWNLDIKELAYIFYKLQERNIKGFNLINIDIPKFITHLFSCKDINDISEQTIKTYITRFNNSVDPDFPKSVTEKRLKVF